MSRSGPDDELRRFTEAELSADAEQLGELLADDFQSIGERGFLLDKTQWIARFADFRYDTIETSDVDVRSYGGAAIVRFAQHSSATWQGQALSLRTRVGQVWIRQDDRWQLAAIQFSSLPDA